jgi:bla regulator protein blaR1
VANRLRDRRPPYLVPLLAVTVSLAGAMATQGQGAPQAAAEPEPAFEVASVKKSGPMPQGGFSLGMRPNGRFSVSQMPLVGLITMAYGIQRYQVVGGPGWITTDRFDINAKAEDGAPSIPPPSRGMPTTTQLMLRSLLKDRFKLVVHTETREFSVSHLVVARSDGKLGPNLKPSSVDCAKLMAERARGTGAGPVAFPPMKPGEIPQCGMMGGIGRIAGGGMPLTMLVQMLTSQLNRPVLDKTNLTGNFDILLEYTPDRMPELPPGATLPPGLTLPSPDGPSLLTAIQEQLGLKIENTRGPVDVIVIDAVEQPTPD